MWVSKVAHTELKRFTHREVCGTSANTDARRYVSACVRLCAFVHASMLCDLRCVRATASRAQDGSRKQPRIGQDTPLYLARHWAGRSLHRTLDRTAFRGWATIGSNNHCNGQRSGRTMIGSENYCTGRTLEDRPTSGSERASTGDIFIFIRKKHSVSR